LLWANDSARRNLGLGRIPGWRVQWSLPKRRKLHSSRRLLHQLLKGPKSVSHARIREVYEALELDFD
jgi:hypothetical protein